ncbi:MAG: hypothetical protein JXB47_00480 [Anaerolineae bacterium]|nr:hypothetical protein [Anaerolineae bacterium]
MERFVIKWLQPIEPIYCRETGRRTQYVASQTARRARRGCLTALALLFGVGAMLVCGSGGGGIPDLFIVFLFIIIFTVIFWGPFLVPVLYLILRVRVVAVAGDAIAREVEAQTWDLLRVLPWPVEALVQTKYAGALVRARRLFYQLAGLRAAAAVWLMTLGVPAVIFAGERAVELWFAAVLGLIYYLIETPLDFATDGALGVLASTFARTQGQALAVSAAMSVVGIGGQVALDVILIMLLGAQAAVVCAVAVVVVLALRCALLRGLLALAARRAACL